MMLVLQTILTFTLYIGIQTIHHVPLEVAAYIPSRLNDIPKTSNGDPIFAGDISTKQAYKYHKNPLSIFQCGRNTNLRLSNEKLNDEITTTSRRDIITSAFKIPIFAIASYAYGRVLYNALSSTAITTLFNNGAPIYPIQHEQRIEAMIQKAFDAASATTRRKEFRVLEIGIGTEARLIRRGLYNNAFRQLSNVKDIHQLEITGLDLRIPTKDIVVNDVNTILQQMKDKEGIDITLKLIQSSITDPLPQQYSDGYFDAIVFCFTLCSVSDPTSALRTMKRLLRPNGGTIAYLEHVAVNSDDSDHRLLSIEQQVFDPLQQVLADHCHLHRPTEATIDNVLQVDDNASTGTSQKYQTLFRERFYVDDMWPVSCQACGVIQSTL